MKFAHRFLLTGTILIVWTYHKRVLMKGGYNLLKFSGETFLEFDRTYHQAEKKDMVAVALNG